MMRWGASEGTKVYDDEQLINAKFGRRQYDDGPGAEHFADR